jgi:AcrR family transcriptional regulator
VNVVHTSAPTAKRADTPRQRRRRETHAEIHAAAARLLAREGLAALTMQRVAGEIGYTPGALYRYYGSKHALIEDLLRAAADALEADLVDAHGRAVAWLGRERRPDRREAALLPLLVAAGTLAEQARRRPAQHELLARAVAGTGEAAALPAAALGPLLVAPLDHFARLFAAAAAAGALARGDPAARAVCLWSALHGLAASERLARLGAPRSGRARLRAGLLRALLVGFGAERARVAAVEPRAARLVRAA